MTANAAFYVGLVRTLAEADRPLWTTTPFALINRDLHAAARLGLAAALHWDGADHAAAPLILDVLLPLAADGLDSWGVAAAHRDPPTAAALARDLLAATAGRTTLHITHRLTGLAAVDEVLVFHAGRVVERGTHAELLRNGSR